MSDKTSEWDDTSLKAVCRGDMDCLCAAWKDVERNLPEGYQLRGVWRYEIAERLGQYVAALERVAEAARALVDIEERLDTGAPDAQWLDEFVDLRAALASLDRSPSEADRP